MDGTGLNLCEHYNLAQSRGQASKMAIFSYDEHDFKLLMTGAEERQEFRWISS
jgi:hypothetical protein